MNNYCEQCDCGCECGDARVSIGAKVPDWELDAYHKDDFKKIKLSNYKGKWLVLIFYPADFTFVCPTELEEAATHYSKFTEEGAEILSVSTDTKYAHKAWHNSSKAIGKVTYPMLADPTGEFSRLFGTYIKEGEDAGLSLRGTFIIDPDGVLKTMEIHDNSIGRSTGELLRKLKAAKFVREHDGNVCPASWEPGKDTLTPGPDLVGKI
ncbi:MAG: redoxin domain-containing protein [Patescibacteria group bacterium]